MKINTITYISFKSNISQKPIEQANKTDSCTCDLNNQPSNTINQSLINRKDAPLLKQKFFRSNPKYYESCLSVFRKRNLDYVQENPQTGELEFKKELNPKKLPIAKGKFKGFEISNFKSPNGSIAMQTRLKTAISTSGLYQCAAVAFVDKKRNIQTLLHLCPTIDKKSNTNLLKYLISNANKNDLEISIVHGCDKYTDDTITFLIDFIKENCPNAQVNFMEYPDEYKNILLLNNGDLQVLDTHKDFEILATNPNKRIIYA